MFTTNKEIILIIVSYVMLIILILFIFIFLIQISKRRKLKFKVQLELEQQKLIQAQLENELAILTERERIMAELHDDLGSGLTSIKMLTELALLQPKNRENIEIEKIKTHATTLVQSLSDIVWEMNKKHDKNFMQYVIVYATEYCNEHNTYFNFYIDENLRTIVIDGLKRRNLFLVIKETLHNTIKHAYATQITIKFLLQNSQLIVTIHDNGKGINIENLRAFGNGLQNMQIRMNSIAGSYTIENNKGTLTTLTLTV